MYDVDIVMNIVYEFLIRDYSFDCELKKVEEVEEMLKLGILLEASKLMVVKLIDGYLVEIIRDFNLFVLKFVEFVDMVFGISRLGYDALYRVIDMYFKVIIYIFIFVLY